MAAQAWKLFKSAKHRIGTNTLALNGAKYRLSFCSTITSKVAVSTFHGLNYRVATHGTDYLISGENLSTGVWTGYGSANSLTRKFDLTNPGVITASATAITAMNVAVLWKSAATSATRYLLAYATLTTTYPLTVGKSNTLTVQMATSGVFTLY